MEMTLRKRLLAATLAAVCAGLAGPTFGQTVEKPLAPERNPPGDIPDTQVFITFASALGFMIKVPEGWARAEQTSSVRFSDKYNMVEVNVSSSGASPTAASVKTAQMPELQKTGRAVTIVSVKDLKLSAGPAVLIKYTANSDPNLVTDKQIRLEHDRYLFYKDGKLATLDMAAPQGADNVDDWSLMANSFRWQ